MSIQELTSVSEVRVHESKIETGRVSEISIYISGLFQFVIPEKTKEGKIGVYSYYTPIIPLFGYLEQVYLLLYSSFYSYSEKKQQRLERV